TSLSTSLSDPLFLSLTPYHSLLFFFNDTPTPEIYTLSLHDALPICPDTRRPSKERVVGIKIRETAKAYPWPLLARPRVIHDAVRSEEHTSELQSLTNLVCRLLLEKKKQTNHLNNAQQQHSSQREYTP